MFVHTEKIFPCNIIAPKTGEHIFLRLNLDQEVLWSSFTIPMLFAKAPLINNKYWDEDFKAKLIKDHHNAALRLKNSGFRTCVIAADNDGCLQKILSPRYSLDDLTTRMQPLLAVYQDLSQIIEDTWVVLTIEELAPGGFDASDGILVAQQLELMGLKNLIITAGTRDFPPLYERRPTQKKHEEQEDFCSHEPGMASTLWALKHTKLTIWYLGFIHDRVHALALAKQLGLAGLIDRA